MLIVLCLEITSPITIFELDTCLGCCLVATFATHDIGDTVFKGGNYAYMEHVTVMSQEDLSTTSNNHNVSCSDCTLDDTVKCFMVGFGICCHGNWRNDRYQWLNQL